jgi:hypothetical protein
MFRRGEINRTEQVSEIDEFLVSIMRRENRGAMLPPNQPADELEIGYQSKSGKGKPSIPLTDKEEEEFNHYNYRSKLPIFITGETEKRATNIILVNGIRVPIGDVSFALFLRLVVELFKNKNGAVSKAKLINAGYINADGEYQAISRLRQAFEVALDSLSPYEFIESCEHKAIRLSTHPAFISYDKEKLRHHHNKKVRKLAERLP